nr:hypothetical protein [Tanacetum cinerariifolium]
MHQQGCNVNKKMEIQQDLTHHKPVPVSQAENPSLSVRIRINI